MVVKNDLYVGSIDMKTGNGASISSITSHHYHSQIPICTNITGKKRDQMLPLIGINVWLVRLWDDVGTVSSIVKA
jgi:hypothetical protein